MFPPPSSNPPEYFRVDIPQFPNAIATSTYGSIVETPPRGIAYRPVSWAVVDAEIAPSDSNVVVPEDLHQALGSTAWHNQGYLGDNVRIAVFDVEWQGAEWQNGELGSVQTHDCFAHASCELPIDSNHPRFGFERGVHGLACAEVIRDIAPAAEIHLVRVLGQTSLENAVDWAIRADVDFISMSLSFFNESFYDGTGPINDLMDTLRDNDIVMVTSAGNYARGHHRTFFEDVDLNGNHDFEDARGLPVYFTKGRRNIQVVWDDFQQCGWNDINAFLWNKSGDLIAKGVRQQSPFADACHPAESIVVEIETDQWTFLTLENEGYGQPAIDIMARGGYIYNSQRSGSIVDPGMHPSVLTVGAVRVNGYLFNDVESFSSAGPVVTLDSMSKVEKPEIVAPNGLDTMSYGSKGFFGTSASTPATVGALALYKTRYRDLSNHDLTQRLIEQSVQIQDFDYTNSVYGKIRLPDPAASTAPANCSSSVGLCLTLFLWRFAPARNKIIGYTTPTPLRKKGS